MKARHTALTWLAAGTLMLGAASATAEIYRYVDRNGVPHYSDSIGSVPFEYRDQLAEISGDLAKNGGLSVTHEDGAAEDADAGEAAGFSLGQLAAGATSEEGGESAGAGLLQSLGFGIVLLVIVAIPILYVIGAGLLMLSCKLAGADPLPSLGRACGILFVQGLAGAAVGGLIAGVGMLLGIDETASVAHALALNGASSMLSWMVGAAVLSQMMSYSFGRSLWVGVVQTLLVIALVVGPIVGIAAIASIA